MTGLSDKVAQSHAILNQAFAEHAVAAMFGLFSGGHDSLVATHLASQHPRFTAAAHMNTTIGIEATRRFVRSTSEAYQWRLREFLPPATYREIVLEHGFPGPGGHRFMYIRLKERSVRQLVREAKTRRADRIMLVTGVRLSESTRRMGNVEPIARDRAQLWVAPILHWTDDDKDEYMALHSLPRNPVVDRLCMSGECLCGAFAKPEEMAELEEAYPEVAEELRGLERDAAAAGVYARWGKRPGRRVGTTGAMCSSCDARAE